MKLGRGCAAAQETILRPLTASGYDRTGKSRNYALPTAVQRALPALKAMA
jgi:hypothetical protein